MNLPHWVVPLACAALAACQAQHNAAESSPPTVSALLSSSEAAIPTLEYVGTELRAYGTEDYTYYRFMDIIRFTNPTAVVFEFTGEAVTWPLWDRASQADNGEWVVEGKPVFCGTLLGPQKISPGQSAYFPAHSTRTFEEPGRFSRVQLEMTNVVTGEKVIACTAGFTPVTTAKDEALAATLTSGGQPRKPRGARQW